MRHFFMSLKFKITAANSIIICLFICLVSFVWQQTYRHDIYHSTEKYASYILESANKQIEESLKVIEYNIVSLLFDSKFMGIVKGQDEMLTDTATWNNRKYMLGKLNPYMTISEHIDHITVATKNGQYYSPTSAYTRDKQRFCSYFEMLKDSSDTVVVISDKVSTKYVNDSIPNLTMIRPIRYVNKTIGLIVVDLDLRSLMGVYDAIDKFDSVLVLYDIRNEQKVYIGESTYRNENYEKLIQPYLTGEKETGDYVVKKVASDKVFIKTCDIKSYQWRILATISQKSLLTGYSDAFKINIILVSFSVLFCFVCVYQMVRFSMRNIDKLTRAVENVKGSHLQLNIEIASRDETGMLYKGFHKMLERIINQMEIIRKNEKEKRKLQFHALQAQINPHFLYNSLNTIKFLSQMQGADNIVEVTDALSRLMHMNMSSQEYFTLKQEIEFLKAYICMQEYKYGREIHFDIHMEEGLEKVYILKLLLQPIVENSIKHGEILENNNGEIKLIIYVLKGMLHINMKDNGIGISKEKLSALYQNLEKIGGIGLYNVQQRIRLYYGESSSISFYNGEEEGFIVKIVIPLQLKQPD